MNSNKLRRFPCLLECPKCDIKWKEYTLMNGDAKVDITKVIQAICEPCRGRGSIPKQDLGHDLKSSSRTGSTSNNNRQSNNRQSNNRSSLNSYSSDSYSSRSSYEPKQTKSDSSMNWRRR